jgi:hypothetical protein
MWERIHSRRRLVWQRCYLMTHLNAGKHYHIAANSTQTPPNIRKIGHDYPLNQPQRILPADGTLFAVLLHATRNHLSARDEFKSWRYSSRSL